MPMHVRASAFLFCEFIAAAVSLKTCVKKSHNLAQRPAPAFVPREQALAPVKGGNFKHVAIGEFYFCEGGIFAHAVGVDRFGYHGRALRVQSCQRNLRCRAAVFFGYLIQHGVAKYAAFTRGERRPCLGKYALCAHIP